MAGCCVALIGGGRWGRVHASVLTAMSHRVERVLWVSRHNKASLGAFISQRSSNVPAFEILSSLDSALAEHPHAAIVATAPVDHASTVELLLRGGVSVLVEKPFALSLAEANLLVRLSEQRGLVLRVGLHLFKASYLQRFRAAIAERS